MVCCSLLHRSTTERSCEWVSRAETRPANAEGEPASHAEARLANLPEWASNYLEY